MKLVCVTEFCHVVYLLIRVEKQFVLPHRYGKAVATAYVQGILTSEPCNISLLFFLWYLHSGGGELKHN